MKFENNRRFGIEIEVTDNISRSEIAEALVEAGIDARTESYNHTTQSYWKVTTDGSCGYEVVSPPLQGYEGLEEVETVCKVLNELGCKVNKNCGLHIHHDASDLNRTMLLNVAMLYAKWEKVIDAIMPPSRRGNSNSYCRSFWYRNINDVVETTYRTRRVDSDYGIGRYMKVNLEAYERHGTVEFRQHSGTTDFSKIQSWLVITQNFVTKAKVNRKAVRNVNPNHISIKRFRDWIGCTGMFVEDEVSKVASKWMMKRFRQFNPEVGLYDSLVVDRPYLPF